MPHALLLLLLLAAPAPVAPALQSIALRAEATVTGDRVTLGDLADLAPAGAAAAAGALDVTPAPPVGCSTQIARGYLRLRLRRAGLRLEGIAFTGPDRITVTRLAPPPGPSAGEATPTAPAGAAAPPAALPALPTVPRGTHLRLVLRIGELTVETSAELLAAAVPGGPCRVRTTDSRVVLEARLLDSQTAEVKR
jgi:hypothetical protein